ncbi:hypothetical protein [Hyphomonas sp.]|uniref:hypothetical protein n=1 Tax=Hyphomonas sp. TaxID=87 RepID=UPI0030FADF6E
MSLPPDFDEDLIQALLPWWTSPHRFRPAFPDRVSEVGTEAIAPETDTLMADINAALMEYVVVIAKRERRANVDWRTSPIRHHASISTL